MVEGVCSQTLPVFTTLGILRPLSGMSSVPDSEKLSHGVRFNLRTLFFKLKFEKNQISTSKQFYLATNRKAYGIIITVIGDYAAITITSALFPFITQSLSFKNNEPVTP